MMQAWTWIAGLSLSVVALGGDGFLAPNDTSATSDPGVAPSSTGGTHSARAVELYGVDSTTATLVRIDKTTGATTPVGPVGVSVVGSLAWDAAAGVCYGTDTSNWNLITIDLATGATTVVGPTNIYFPHCSAIDPATGNLYSLDIFNGEFYSVDKTTGAKTFIGYCGYGDVGALDFDPTTGILYGARSDPFGFGHLITIDLATGAATLVGTTYRFTSLAFDEYGNLFAAENGFITGTGSDLYSIDKTTGNHTLIGSLGLHNVLGIEFPHDPVAGAKFRNAAPNPASYTAATLPVLGTTYTGHVDVGGTTGHSHALLAGYGAPLTFPFQGWTGLVHPGGPEYLGLPAAIGPVASIDVPIPPDPAYAGYRVFTQAAHFGGGQPVALANAQDLTLGY